MPQFITEVLIRETHDIEVQQGGSTIGQLIDDKIREIANDLGQGAPPHGHLNKIEFSFTDESDWFNYIHGAPVTNRKGKPRRGEATEASY